MSIIGANIESGFFFIHCMETLLKSWCLKAEIASLRVRVYLHMLMRCNAVPICVAAGFQNSLRTPRSDRLQSGREGSG